MKKCFIKRGVINNIFVITSRNKVKRFYSPFLGNRRKEKSVEFKLGDNVNFPPWINEMLNGGEGSYHNNTNNSSKRYMQHEAKQEKENETKLLELTTNAINKLKEIQMKYHNSKVLKINIEAGGCSGFQYSFTLVDKTEKEKKEILVVYEKECGIIINKAAVDILRNSKVDYVKDLMGNRFVIENIPNVSTKCSCGNSFDLKT